MEHISTTGIRFKSHIHTRMERHSWSTYVTEVLYDHQMHLRMLCGNDVFLVAQPESLEPNGFP